MFKGLKACVKMGRFTYYCVLLQERIIKTENHERIDKGRTAILKLQDRCC